MTLRLFIILISFVLLSACGMDRTKREVPPQIITKWRTYDCGIPPARDHITFRLPKFVVSPEGLYTLTAEEYGDLGENMADIIKASGQLLETIRFYQQCIEAANAVDTEA